MKLKQAQVVIIGGGISGLATAYYLEKQAVADGLSLKCSVVEKAQQLGGKIASRQDGDFIIEGGPESFVTRKPWAWELSQELGLGDELVPVFSAGKNYVLHNGRPAMVPMSPAGLAKTPLLSAKGKARLLQEPFIKKGAAPNTPDEPLADFLTRRLGHEAAENLAGPAVGSIYLSDIHHLSTRVTFGQFADWEAEHGSLIKGAVATVKAKRTAQKENPPAQTDTPAWPINPATGKPKRPVFVSPRQGVSNLIEALAQAIQGDILTGVGVEALTRQEGQAENGPAYHLKLSDGQTLTADAVVLAVPTFAMADLLRPHLPEKAELLAAVPYIPVTTITLAYKKTDFPDFDGYGVVVPRTESAQVLACEFSTNKFPHRAPADTLLVRVFLGGYSQPHLANLSEAEMLEVIKANLFHIFDVVAPPLNYWVFRWPKGNPQYPIGHLDNMDAVESQLKQVLPQVHLTGSGMRGLGLPDCVRQARETATNLLQGLQEARLEAV